MDKKIFAILSMAVVAIAVSAQSGSLEQGVVYSVESVRTWESFDGITPDETLYQKWSSNGPASRKENRYTPDQRKSEGKFVELLIWFDSKNKEEVDIEMIPQGGEALDCKLLYGNNRSAAVKAFVIPGTGSARNRLMIEEWKGNLSFKLKPEEKTWILLLFDIPVDISEAKLQIKKSNPVSVTISKTASNNTTIRESQPLATNNQNAIDLELNKAYSVQGFEFTVQTVKIHKGSYPMGMFSGRPSNPNMDPSYDGVLGIELSLTKGNGDTFSELEKYLVNEKGERNVKEDRVIMSNAPKFTIMFNVPMSARKIKFGIGTLELNLEKVLNEPEPISNNVATSESPPLATPPATPPASNRQPVEIRLSPTPTNRITHENKTYPVSMGTITNDGQGTVIVEIVTEEEIEIPIKNGAAVAPIMMKIESNGKTIVASDKVSILDNSMSFNFREIPDKVIVYGNDDKTDAPTVTFNITEEMIKGYRSLVIETPNTPEVNRSANVTANGKASPDIAWRVEDKTLIVSGRGDIPGNPSWSSVVNEYSAAVIGDGITSIGNHAFAMSKIKSIVIGKDVTNINTYALFNCSDLVTVEVRNPVPPKLASFVFMLTPIGKAKLIVPVGSKAAYSRDRSWNRFGVIEER